MIIEIRTYRLIPGSSSEFKRILIEQARPLIEESGIRVVDCGVSLVRDEGHEEGYLIRAFHSHQEREEQEGAFYSSASWLQGPRAEFLSHIEQFHTIVLETSAEAVQALSTAAKH